MSSERQVYVLYGVEFSSRILLPKVVGQCRKVYFFRRIDLASRRSGNFGLQKHIFQGRNGFGLFAI